MKHNYALWLLVLLGISLASYADDGEKNFLVRTIIHPDEGVVVTPGSDKTPTPYSSVEIDGLVYTYMTTVSRNYVGVEAANIGITEANIKSSVTLDGIVCPVTEIEWNAFEGCNKLKSVRIGSSITTIGYKAFAECDSLHEVIFPSDVSKSMEISNFAFMRCPNLEEIIIPDYVSSVGYRAFWECTSLKSIAFAGADTKLDTRMLEGCTSLTSAALPAHLEEIPEGCFYNCDQLSAVQTISSINGKIFPILNGICRLDSVKKIGDNAFANCTSIQNFYADKLDSIGKSAFFNCKGLKTFTVCKSVKYIGESAFYGSVDDLLFYPKWENYALLDDIGLTWSDRLYAYSSEIRQIKTENNYLSCEILPIDLCPEGYIISSVDAYLTRIGFTVNPYSDEAAGDLEAYFGGERLSPDVDGVYWLKGLMPDSAYIVRFEIGNAEKEISFRTAFPFTFFTGEHSDYADPYLCGFKSFNVYISQDESLLPEEVGVRVRKAGTTEYAYYTAEDYDFSRPAEESQGNAYEILLEVLGLVPGTEYEMSAFSTYKGKRYYDETYIMSTRVPEFTMEMTDSTRTSLAFSVGASSDETGSPEKLGIRCVRRDYSSSRYNYYEADRNRHVVVDNLLPGRTYEISVYAVYNGGYVFSDPVRYVIESVSPWITAGSLSPTTVTLMGHYIRDGFVPDSTQLRFGSQISRDGSLELSGLEPGTKYSANFSLYKDGESCGYASFSFTTDTVSFRTLPAQAVSNTCALIAAECNISENETGCGFEWRRYDAPDLVPSTFSPCFVADSMLAGRLEGLSANTYYKYRPYYRSASGTYYYGEWIAFGTADAYVYFEPVVYTAAPEVDGTAVCLRGQALAGSEPVVRQGFEYWEEASPALSAKRVAGAVQTVLAEGTRMEAELKDLLPGATYVYRAFVTTAMGTTYGETRSFSLPGAPVGIEETAAASGEKCLDFSVRHAGQMEICVSGSSAERCVCRVTDTAGRTVLSASVLADRQWHPLDEAGALPAGLYVLTLTDGTEVKSRTVLVE